MKVKKWKKFKKHKSKYYDKKILDASEVAHGSFGYDGKVGIGIAGKSA
ncbi:MAG: hypothetical protein WC716_16490 [Chitinophagaceae bacterium]|jgi:hypothetical protein